jgi:hypothetical protein
MYLNSLFRRGFEKLLEETLVSTKLDNYETSVNRRTESRTIAVPR